MLEPAPFVVEATRCAGCVDIETYRERDEIKERPEGLQIRLQPNIPKAAPR